MADLSNLDGIEAFICWMKRYKHSDMILLCTTAAAFGALIIVSIS